MAYIGVKLANGEFYPIFEEDTPAKKKLVVTTVKDNQPNVQIDLYRGEPSMPADDASYIGSLLVNDIARAPKGMPDIELEVLLHEDKTLEAYAQDRVSGGQSKFSVALTELSSSDIHQVPEFDIHETETLINESLEDSELAGISLDEDLIIEEPVAVKQEEVDDLESGLAEPDALSDDFAVSEDFSASGLPELSDTGDTLDVGDFSIGEDASGPAASADDEIAGLPSLDEGMDTGSGTGAADFSFGGTSLEIPEMGEQADGSSVFGEDSSSILDADEDEGLSGADTMKFDVELPDVPLDSAEEAGMEFPSLDESKTEKLEASDFDLPGMGSDSGHAEDFSSKELSMESGETVSLEDETIFSAEPDTKRVKKTKAPKEQREVSDERRPCAPLWCKILVPLAIVLVAAVVLLLVGRCSAENKPAPVAEKPAVTKPAATTPATGSGSQGGTQTQPSASGQTSTTPAPATTQPAPAPATTAAPATAKQAPASSKPPKPAPGSKTPGVWYKIRWGDTLWDLSIAFYRTPWKYMKIFNQNPKIIKHPDKIISGTWIYVPK